MFEVEDIENLYMEMEEDSIVDREHIVNSAIRLTSIHTKWNHRMTLYRLELSKFESKYNKILNDTRIYYSGKAGNSVYLARPMPMEYRNVKLTKAEIDIIVDADEMVINAREMMEFAKVLCESINHFMFQLNRGTKLIEIIHNSEKFDLMGT